MDENSFVVPGSVSRDFLRALLEIRRVEQVKTDKTGMLVFDDWDLYGFGSVTELSDPEE